jgi:hypothetical protein
LSIILHGSISQKTTLNIILAAVRTWNLTQLTSMGRLLYVVFDDSNHSSLMMEAVRTSETSVDNHFTWQYIPEDNSEHHTRRRENLKSHRIKICL